MKVDQFIELLKRNPGKELRFEYLENRFVEANYHLTEVKNVTFDTTDCGGKTNFWKETHMQLWENPTESSGTGFLTTDKFLAILNRVDKIKPLWANTELKFEYGNEDFNTSVMPVKGFRSSQKYLEFMLFEEAARCKAQESCEPSVCC
jgi:hypothetical protein